MKKLKGSVIAKIIARAICTVSIIGSVVFGLFVFIGFKWDMFYTTREDMRKRAYEEGSLEYSSQAMDNMGNSAFANTLRENYFLYGIIEGNSLGDVDFYDRKSYLETNMTDEELKAADLDKLYACLIVKGLDSADTICSFGPLDENIRSLETDVYQNMTKQWKRIYADRICYDESKGILYYRAEDKYYPVQNMSLWYDGGNGRLEYNYVYDFDSGSYRLEYKGYEAEEQTTKTADVFLVQEAPLKEAASGDIAYPGTRAAEIEAILNGTNGTVNFAALNNTSFDHKNWGMLRLDGVREIDGAELTVINSGRLEPDQFVVNPYYYLDENYTLVVMTDVDAESYWIVSILPDSVPNGLVNNRYSERGWPVNLYYDVLDMNVFLWLGVSLIVAAVSFFFLASAAGHRKSQEKVVLTLFDRIPLDLLSVVVLPIEFIIFFKVAQFVASVSLIDYMYFCTGLSRSVSVTVTVIGLVSVTVTVIGLEYLLSLCARVKAGKWWRNSVCYWIFGRIGKVAGYVLRNVGLLWKFFVIMVIFSIVQMIIVATNRPGNVVVLLFLGNLAICGAVSLLIVQISRLQEAGRRMAGGDLAYKVNTEKMFWECKRHGENLNRISEGMAKAVDERMKSERLRTELITNVSHDIKTPLTSIINYVDLLSKEELQNGKAAEYIEVLERQSSKLKKLIEDLVEASKASTGNLAVDSQRMEAGVFLTQTVGEFEERLSLAGLELIVNKPEEPVYIMADGRHMWRVIDNLMNNICKYSQPGSRVYVNLDATEKAVAITFRNISKYPLNVSGEELMERFVRGDKSRNTEGHGLGLSIAQSLVKLSGSGLDIVVDGDLFKVVLTFEQCM